MASHLYDAVVALRAELAKDTLHTYIFCPMYKYTMSD
jgi:hypothetical protein